MNAVKWVQAYCLLMASGVLLLIAKVPGLAAWSHRTGLALIGIADAIIEEHCHE